MSGKVFRIVSTHGPKTATSFGKLEFSPVKGARKQWEMFTRNADLVRHMSQFKGYLVERVKEMEEEVPSPPPAEKSTAEAPSPSEKTESQETDDADVSVDFKRPFIAEEKGKKRGKKKSKT